MQPLTSAQLKKLEKLAKVIDGGDIALLTQLGELEERVDTVLTTAEEAIQVARETKKMKGDDGYTPVKGKDYFDGEDYVLTAQDKKEIAGAITVPVVERVIEKTVVREVPGETIIREIPIVTNEIKEVATLDDAIVGYLEDKIDHVQNYVKAQASKHSDGLGLVVRQLRAGTGVTIDDSNQEYPVVSATGGPAGSGITRTIVVTSGNTTLGATASTDYACLVNGAHTITMPTAVGNTNQYTIKNIHTSDIIVNTTSSQTIDGTTTITIAPEDSVDLVSNNSNWYVI